MSVVILIAYSENVSVCACCRNGGHIPLFGYKIKNLKLFPENIWLFGRRVLTLRPETKKWN